MYDYFYVLGSMDKWMHISVRCQYATQTCIKKNSELSKSHQRNKNTIIRRSSTV